MKTPWLLLLLSSVVWAEEQYYPQSDNITWDEARLYCQQCFKELTTITSRNIHLIANNLSVDYWIGLRRSYNGTLPWSKWSNEDPVTYQNWYPGHPVPNTEIKQPICPTTQTPLTSTSSITTTSTSTPTTTTMETSSLMANNTGDMCPILVEILDCLNLTYKDLESTVHSYMITTPKTTTHSTLPTVTTTYSTQTTPQSTTVSSCILEPEPDPDVYIEDACVVLLSFGMWKEKVCNISRPFICYDDRFFGQINYFNVMKNSVNLSWSAGPGAKNISHYRVEITGDYNQTFNKTDLSAEITSLTSGTLYRAQVFPVKCGRDLNPQNISFYTLPSAVIDLTVLNVTTDSAFLNWSRPDGNQDFYLVIVEDLIYGDNKTKNCSKKPWNSTDLTPGVLYNFTVFAVVNMTTYGVPSKVSVYTNPSKVKNLIPGNNESNAIVANWDNPSGYRSSFNACIEELSSSNCIDCNMGECSITNDTSINMTALSSGTQYCLCVTALTNSDTQPGETVVSLAFTQPNTVSVTSLVTYSTSMSAYWTIEGKYTNFLVTIQTTDYHSTESNYSTTERYYNFSGLMAAVRYSITIITFNGKLQSDPAVVSDYTRPTSARSPKATVNKRNITVSWEPPSDSKDARINYTVTYHTSFWGEYYTSNTSDTQLTFDNLRSGTTYDFNIAVVAGILTSNPVSTSAQTEPVKKVLSLVMLCSSVHALECATDETLHELYNKLSYQTAGKLDGVYWKLKWVDRK
ncbi:receptor-type tyrosine-protein phosphatase eta [Danio aesculapii]|uniref:receptor-type tyrosine-protein phosphatase eta n=1 Tax=Danio aesculapii TaxID=1142201 RepID=UPI0024BF4930|nr:receptor-type tyrosine-protein phosphatase eta [Danio aesculapii]